MAWLQHESLPGTRVAAQEDIDLSSELLVRQFLVSS